MSVSFRGWNFGNLCPSTWTGLTSRVDVVVEFIRKVVEWGRRYNSENAMCTFSITSKKLQTKKNTFFVIFMGLQINMEMRMWNVCIYVLN